MTRSYRKAAFAAYPAECDICKGTEQLEVHHRDLNHANNDISNLRILCQDCHWNVHRGLTWSDEIGDWDTPYNRERFELDRRWETGAKETVSITVDSEVLAGLRRMAIEQFGTEDVGRLITYIRLRLWR